VTTTIAVVRILWDFYQLPLIVGAAFMAVTLPVGAYAAGGRRG
jgi:hypothetical protein